MRVGLHHPRRYDIRDHIRTLDPERDRDEIAWLVSRHEFPWDYNQGTGVAFLRDYGIPSIAALLDQTGEFEHDGVKRYDDTLLVAEEASVEGIDSERGRATLRRLNRIHGHYDIPNDEFCYVLATTIVGPVEWIRAYGWRGLEPVERQALANLTTRFGELMGIKGLPTTYDGYLTLLRDYEAERFELTEANRQVTEATLRIGRAIAPLPLKPFARRVAIALMDEPLRLALGMPEQPAWFVAAVRRGLRARALVLRLAPPAPDGVPPPADVVPPGLHAPGPRPGLHAGGAQPHDLPGLDAVGVECRACQHFRTSRPRESRSPTPITGSRSSTTTDGWRTPRPTTR